MADRGAEYLVENGWWQGNPGFNVYGRVCASLAIEHANPDLAVWEVLQVQNAFRKAISMQATARWNDAPERTFEDVLAAFDAAIRHEMEAGEWVVTSTRSGAR